MLSGREWRRRKTRKENKFYTGSVKNGTIMDEKPNSQREIAIKKPRKVDQLRGKINNPEGYRPPGKTNSPQPKAATPRNMTPTKLDMDIAQAQDELAQNPNISNYRRGQLHDKLTKLSADKDVMKWKQTLKHSPSVEDYDAMERRASLRHQYAQEEYANALGNGNMKPGSERSYAMQAKIDKLEEKAKAFNRGMMGVIDGERAVPKDKQDASSATSHGGGQMGRLSFLANNDKPMYLGLNDNNGENHQKQGESSEKETIDLELVKDLMEKIRLYKLDECDPYLKQDTFYEKYDNGEVYNVWIRQLRGLVGDELFNDYMSNYDEWEIPEKISLPEDIIREQAQDEEGDEPSNHISNFFKNVADTVNSTVTGAAKWIKDNQEPIRGIFEAAEAKKQKLLQTPIRNMNEDDFDNYGDITLDNYSDELEIRKPIKYAQELEAEKLGLIEEYNYIPYENKLEWTELGVTNGEEYAQFIIENSDLSDEVLNRVERKQESLYARKEEHLEQVYGLCQELEARENEGKSFAVINETGQDLDQQMIDNAILVGLSNIGDEAGGMGEVLKRYYNDGNVLITITGCTKQYYTQEEAQAFYIEEQDEAKELANLMFGMASADGIGSMLILLADMLLNLNEDEEDRLGAVETIFSTFSEDDIDIEGFTIDKLEDLAKDFVIRFAVNDITDMVRAIRWDIEDVKGGSYLMVDAIYETIDDQNGETLLGKSSCFSSVNQTLRLYEENGLYVSDGLNPLTHTVPLFESASQYNYIPEYYTRDY